MAAREKDIPAKLHYKVVVLIVVAILAMVALTYVNLQNVRNRNREQQHSRAPVQCWDGV